MDVKIGLFLLEKRGGGGVVVKVDCSHSGGGVKEA